MGQVLHANARSTEAVRNMTYPVSCRKKVSTLKAQEGLSFTEVSTRFGLWKSAVFRWSKTLEPQRHRCKSWYTIDEATLRREIEAYPDSDGHQWLGVSTTGIRNVPYQFGITD